MRFLDLFRRGPRRPLALRQPARRSQSVPLGMEATDIDHVNRVARQNDALERTPTIGQGWSQNATDIKPMPDDETYAAQYHSAFQTKEPIR